VTPSCLHPAMSSTSDCPGHVRIKPGRLVPHGNYIIATIAWLDERQRDRERERERGGGRELRYVDLCLSGGCGGVGDSGRSSPPSLSESRADRQETSPREKGFFLEGAEEKVALPRWLRLSGASPGRERAACQIACTN